MLDERNRTLHWVRDGQTLFEGFAEPYMAPPMGLLSLSDFTELLLKPWPHYSSCTDELFAVIGPAFERIENSDAFERLGKLFQFGIKADPRRHHYSIVRDGHPPILVATAPFLQSRQMHSRAVAAHLAALGIRTGVPTKELAPAVLASLLHDIGHSVYCHDGDDFLIRWGNQSHERRGIHIITQDDQIREAFGLIDAHTDAAVSLIREEGRLGLLQKLADTLGYLLLDAETIGETGWIRLSHAVIESVNQADDTRLFVTAREPIEQMLRRRAEMFRNIYCASRNRIAVAALGALLGVMMERRALIIDDLLRGVDTDVEFRISEALLDHSFRWPPWVMSLWNIAHGFTDELNRWHHYQFSDAADFEAYVATAISKLRPHAHTIFFVEPYDYTRKYFLTVGPDDRIQTLRSPVDPRTPDERYWHIFSFKE